ncbi:MAG: Inner membrane protein YbaN [Marine Group II euryarchaeote MED-G33]|nr:MAG: Inner membrane protein YbaN [Marine Group II euryarchaeote MED-G33]|tara:strand:+ start:158 stop:601 length:444 start_codon:yes stop_codon:yes gene_type:complete
MDEPNQVVDSIHQVDLDRSKISRVLWFTTGFIVMTIGLIGIIVPGLPTTPLMILAAACFAKSSQRFYDWIINNKMFGQHVKNYREGNGIPKKSKPIILVTMWTFVLFAVLIAIPDSAPPVSKIATLVLAVIGTIFILRIPNLSQDDS